MAQLLGALTAPPQDLSIIASNHTVAHRPFVTLVPGDGLPLLACEGTALT